MLKKTFMIALLLLVTFIVVYFQYNLFSSLSITLTYFFVALFIDSLLAGCFIIVFDYVFRKKKIKRSLPNEQ